MAQFSSVAMIMGLPPQQQQGRSTTQFFSNWKDRQQQFLFSYSRKRTTKKATIFKYCNDNEFTSTAARSNFFQLERSAAEKIPLLCVRQHFWRDL